MLTPYIEPTNLEPHLGHVIVVHGVPRVCETVYPHFGQLQEVGPPIPCPGPPLPIPNPLLIFLNHYSEISIYIFTQ